MTQLHPAVTEGRGSSTRPPTDQGSEGDFCAMRCLDLNEVLFEAGSRRSEIYEVRAGTVCLYRERYGLPPRIVEMVHSGSILGLGVLETHPLTARAVVPTTLRQLSVEEAEAALERSPRLAEAQAETARHEFIARREAIVAKAARDPVQKLARFLVAIAGLNAREGREPDRIPDELACGVVAGWLETDIDGLSASLLELKRRGLVAVGSDGSLELKDRPALEQLAEAG